MKAYGTRHRCRNDDSLSGDTGGGGGTGGVIEGNGRTGYGGGGAKDRLFNTRDIGGP